MSGTPSRTHATHRAARALATPLAVAALLASAPAQAATLPTLPTVSPFDITGVLQSATLDASGLLAGGTVTVKNQLITIPKNLLVQLPATFLTWPELFRLAPAPYGPTQTGLALADSPTPMTSYEVHVQGNRVGDQYIAGLVFISQVQLSMGQGYVNFVDYVRGELRVGGKIGDPTTGQRVKLNDPIGRFGPTWSPDVRFMVDESNPTVRSTTGFPMCVPRKDPAVAIDPECPQTNRPVDTSGAYLTIFTMPDPALGVPPDATKQTPFEIGDYVTYAGVLVKDGSQPTAGPPTTSGTLVAAYSLIANLGIFTWPGADPAYLAVDVAILGVGGAPIAGVPQEATARTRFEGFSTDPSRIVVLFGVDQDPCSGAISERDWGMIAVDPGPPTGAVLGRWRFRPPSKVLAMPSAGVFLPATRTMRATMVGVPMTVANGLTSGTYEAPIGDYLFPENLAVGGPQVPLNFQEFPFLANGSGPWAGTGPNPVYAGIVGQLAPWPGSPAPTPASCSTTTQPPVANAGTSQTVTAGATVTLDGSLSYDPNGLAMTYAWTQSSGTGVTLSNPAAVKPTFTAPSVSSSATLQFQLVVKDSSGTSAPSTVTITVQPASGTALPPIADAGAAQTVASGATVQLNGTASIDPNTPPLTLTYTWTQIAGPAVTLTGASTATPTFKAPAAAPGVPALLSFWLVVKNSAGLGSTAQVNVTVNPVLAPTANAGANQVVLTNSTVTLDGSASTDPNGLPLTYTWTQIGGPVVTINQSPTSPKATFKAPSFGVVTCVFTLTVNDGYLSSSPAQVSVTVNNQPDIVTILTAQYTTSKQRLTVTATSSAGAQLYLKSWTGGSDYPLELLAGVPTVRLTGVPPPASVTVYSVLGGTATLNVTVK